MFLGVMMSSFGFVPGPSAGAPRSSSLFDGSAPWAV